MKKSHGIKDLFVMSKHERMGTIVVLALMGLLLAATVIVRCCTHETPSQVNIADLEQFDAQTDRTPVVHSQPRSARERHHDKSPRRHRPASKPKPASPPRHVDPVPQF